MSNRLKYSTLLYVIMNLHYKIAMTSHQYIVPLMGLCTSKGPEKQATPLLATHHHH